MAEGLRHHYHQYYEDYVKKYRDSEGVIIKKIFYRCMICGQAHVEKYTCYEPPPKRKYKKTGLEKAHRKYGIRNGD